MSEIWTLGTVMTDEYVHKLAEKFAQVTSTEKLLDDTIINWSPYPSSSAADLAAKMIALNNSIDNPHNT